MLKHTLSRRVAFSCGRQLGVPDWSETRNADVFGKASRPHGHDYTLEAFYSGAPDLDGMIVNLADLKPVLARAVAPLDGAFLRPGEEPFHNVQPTLSNLVDFLWRQLPSTFGAGALSRLRLQETSRDWADKTQHEMTQSRNYEFAAAHRLHAPHLSAEENDALYGRCNNLAGHGHNFGLDVTLSGTPDAQTGLLCPPSRLDEVVEREVFARFDHRHLNVDCPELQGMIPTTENFARVLFQVLEPHLKGENYRLRRVGLRETGKNYFEVEAAEVND